MKHAIGTFALEGIAIILARTTSNDLYCKALGRGRKDLHRHPCEHLGDPSVLHHLASTPPSQETLTENTMTTATSIEGMIPARGPHSVKITTVLNAMRGPSHGVDRGPGHSWLLNVWALQQADRQEHQREPRPSSFSGTTNFVTREQDRFKLDSHRGGEVACSRWWFVLCWWSVPFENCCIEEVVSARICLIHSTLHTLATHQPRTAE